MTKLRKSFKKHWNTALSHAADNGYGPDSVDPERELAAFLRDEGIKASCKFDAIAKWLSKEGVFFRL